MKLSRRRITAALEDYEFDSMEESESVDDADEIEEDIQDDIDEIEEDDVGIELDNNIANHFIAECDRCQGVFITSVIESDTTINSIDGVCPLCNHESTQYLKWVIKDV